MERGVIFYIKPLFLLLLMPLIGLFMFFSHTSFAQAATCTAGASGNWNTTGTWSCGHVPLSTDDVVISAATAVTVTVDTAAVANSVTVTNTAVTGTQTVVLAVGANSLTLSSGGNLAINGGSTNRNAQVTVSTGTITVPGNISFNNIRARFISSGASTTNVGGNFGAGGTLTTSGTGTINFNGSIAQIAGPYATYNNIQINNTGGGISVSGTTTIGGTLLVNTGTLDTDSAVFTVTGATTVNGTLLISNTAGTKTFNDLTIGSGGIMNFTAAEAITMGTLAGAGGNLTINGTGAITGTTGLWTFSKTGGGAIGGTTTSPQTIGSAVFTTNYSNGIPFIVTGTTTINPIITLTNNSTFTANGALSGPAGIFTQGTGAILNIGSTSGVMTLNAMANPNEVHYIGLADQTIHEGTYHHLFIDKPGVAVASGIISVSAITVNGNLTVTSGTLDFVRSTFTVAGTTDIYGTLTDSFGGPAGGDNIFHDLVTVQPGANWAMDVGEVSDFHFGNGLIMDGAGFVSSTGIYYFETNNQSVTGSTPFTIENVTVDSIHLTNGSISTITNLTITGAGSSMSSGDLTVNGVLDLDGGNPSATVGKLDMGLSTLTMGPLATTVGAGDVTGIVKRTSFVSDTSYTFGNQFTLVNFRNVGTLPAQMSFKITIGAAPAWKPDAVQRRYAVIQGGASGSFATIHTHYLDSELNGNTKNKLVYVRSVAPFTPGTEIEFGRSNYDETNNWVAISSIPVHSLPTTFGVAEATLADTDIAAATWNGSVTTEWLNPNNWTPLGIPSDLADIIIPDAAGTTFDPITPTDPLTVQRMTIESGGILSAASASTMTVTGASGAWSNNGGTFNAGTGTVIFTNASATLSGITDFYNVTINAGAGLLMEIDSTMRIAGTMVNSGTWNAAQLDNNTVEYNGGAQTVLNPNGATPGYFHLKLSGTGVKTLPGTTLNMAGDFILAGTASTVANAVMNIGCNLIIGSGTTFDAASFSHSLKCNFVNDGTFIPSTSTFTLNGTASQDISGTSPITFTALTINNAAGVTLTGTNPTVNDVLTFTSGNITTGANNIYISSTGSVLHTLGHIVGNLRKFIQIGATSKTYEVGDAAYYSPVNTSFGNVTATGDLTMGTATGDCLTIGTSSISAGRSVNICWSALNAGVVFDTYDAVFNFINPGSIDVGADPLNFIVGMYDGIWSYPIVGTKTSTSTQITGVAGFSDFQIGEQDTAPTASGVTITGTAAVGDILTGNYTYNDVDGDLEGVSTYRWLRNDALISGATASTYTLVAADAGTIIKFEVTPVSATNATAGTPVQSGGVSGGDGVRTGGGVIEGGNLFPSANPPPSPAPSPDCARNSSTPVPFTDISNNWAKVYIENLYRRCIIDGKTPTIFAPDSFSTRAELVKIVLNTYNLGTAPFENLFLDVFENDWFAKYVTNAAKRGIVIGYVNQDGTSNFKPDQYITRAEALKVMLRTKGITDFSGYTEDFDDVNIGDWFYEYVAFAESKGFIEGYTAVFDKAGLVSKYYSFPRLLGSFNTGEDVRSLKEIMAQIGYYHGEINTIYDAELERAINAYQSAKGIMTTGQMGPVTRGLILTENLKPISYKYFRPDSSITRAEITKLAVLIQEFLVNGV